MQPVGMELYIVNYFTNDVVRFLAPVLLFLLLYTFIIVTLFTAYRNMYGSLEAGREAVEEAADNLRVCTCFRY